MRRLIGVAAVLLAAGSASAEVRLADDKLSLDGWVRAAWHYWFVGSNGLSSTEFVLEPVDGGAGITGRLNDRVSLRASAGFNSYGSFWLQDALVRFDWSGGWSLTAGQFLLPVSLDASILPEDYPLDFSGALHTGYVKPAGRYDVGVMGAYKSTQLEAMAGVVNGLSSSAWSGDNRFRKDLCGRIMAQPWCSWPWLGGRIYRGFETDGKAWLTWGVEALHDAGRLHLAAEYQNHISRNAHNNSAYAQGRYELGRFEPGLRLEAILPAGKRLEYNVTAGATFRPFDAVPVKLALHYSQHASLEGRWSVGEVLLRLQAEL